MYIYDSENGIGRNHGQGRNAKVWLPLSSCQRPMDDEIEVWLRGKGHQQLHQTLPA